jgi:hypothetical protein
MSDLPIAPPAAEGAEPAAREPYALARRGWTPAARPPAPVQARWLPASVRASTQTLAPRPVWPALPGAGGDELDGDVPAAPSALLPKAAVADALAHAQPPASIDTHRSSPAGQPQIRAEALPMRAPPAPPAAASRDTGSGASPAAPPLRSTPAQTAAATPQPAAPRSAWQQVAAWIDGGDDADAPTPAPAIAQATQAPGARTAEASARPAANVARQVPPPLAAPREAGPRSSHDIVVPLRRNSPALPSAQPQPTRERPTPAAALPEPTEQARHSADPSPARPAPEQRPRASAPTPPAAAALDLSALLAPPAPTPTLRIDHLEVVAPGPQPAAPPAPRSGPAAAPAAEAATPARATSRPYRSPWSARRAGWD